MRNVGKKIFGLAAAATLLATSVAFSACGKESYKGDELTDYVSNAEVVSNGGFVVEKGDFVYFINGAEEYTAANGYGSVVKGALMRISKTDLAAGDYTNVKMVVPSLLGTAEGKGAGKSFDAGIFIYGDYVYYTTPTTDKNITGDVLNSQIDIKRAKLDGSEAPMDQPFFRIKSHAATYRFVTVDGVDRNNDNEDDVFCLYESDSKLQSFNTATKENTVLVSGAASSFVYDESDPTNPNVYYTMSVVYDADSENSTTPDYQQLYCVNAAAKVAKVDADKASYEVEGGRTYDFNEAWMKDNAEKNGYDLKDYTTYPYVNLGTLALDGVGYASAKRTQFNNAAEAETVPAEPQGYKYTITRYATSGENTGVYFTRTPVVQNGSETSIAKLYYLTDAREDWNTISGNAQVDLVANNTTNASANAIFEVNTNDAGKRVHSYIYLSGTILYKATAAENGEASNVIPMAYEIASGTTLWKTQGNYLYYYATGTNGNNLSRINYKGDAEAYNDLLVSDEYKPVTLALVDWNSAWYYPEFVGDVLLYSNAQSYAGGSTAYNYIYATKIGSTANILQDNKDLEAYNDYLENYSDNADTQSFIKFLFEANAEVPEISKTEYFKDYLDGEERYEEIVAKFAGSEEETALRKANSYSSLVSKMIEDDANAIAEAWKNSLPQPAKDATTESEWPDWATWLIVIGSVLIVAAGVAIPLAIVMKKKKAARLEAEATVNAYKRKKIDTTDDKSIDVYADDQAEETQTETAAEAADEAVEEVVEEVVEETEDNE